ncbi:hypothetical protein G3N56_03705 [Desulfovibrio sulfodismutans]|uniref:Uncharacterized protein n=1 Tax=Desulfolutivibrio sulfodismutans TaxID=63561 RepID=A0A7K3NI23_9BACT|nr:hypothetical protein [Desulfolutivibrio sulfodismutans]NDY55846.1 hypothetical protein [Desulfolutivibrio sulfodismutans]QLA14248.1 hypothetical protein GD606_19245 [Desulfolutivibrio sulfodismutans DSM 3696]
MSEMYYFHKQFVLNTMTSRFILADIDKHDQYVGTDKLAIHIGFGRTALAYGKVGLIGVNILDDVFQNSNEDLFSTNSSLISQYKYESKYSETGRQWLVDWNFFDKFEIGKTSMRYHDAMASKIPLNLGEFEIVFIEFSHCIYNDEIAAILGNHIKSRLVVGIADSLQCAQVMQRANRNINYLGFLAFINQENAHERYMALDRISAAILMRGLICIDVEDLSRVIANNVSACLSFSCELSEYYNNFMNFITMHYDLIANSPRLFIVMSFDEDSPELIKITDYVITQLENIATQAEILFAAGNLLPASINTFELTIIVNS